MITLRAGGGKSLPGMLMQRPGRGAGGGGGHSLLFKINILVSLYSL